MRKTHAAIAVVLAVLADSPRALAQDRPVEISGGVGVVTSLTGAAASGGHFGLTIPVNDRFAVDGFVAFGHEKDRTAGLYAIQMQQRILRASRPGFETFITYGLTGYYEDGRATEYRYTENYVTPPMILVFGGGIQRTLAPHLAVRLDGQLLSLFVLPVGLRAAVGISIPLVPLTRASHAAASR